MKKNRFAAEFLRRLAILLLCTFAGSALAARTSKWTITEIAAPGASFISVEAVNNAGDIAGYFSGPVPGLPYEYDRGFLWRNGVLRDLGFPPGKLNSRIYGMNDRGVLVGTSMYQDALMWKDGTWTSLGFRGEARSINRSGAIAGNFTTYMGYIRGFFLNNGLFWELGTFGGWDSYAWAVNDRNQVVGNASLDNLRFHAILWENGVMKDLGTLGGVQSSANDINNRGVVVGSSLDRDFGWATFIYDGDFRRLFNLPGTHTAKAINERGQVVGTIDNGAFLYDNGVLTRLDQLPAVIAAGWKNMRPTALNDRGWIVGNGLNAQNKWRGFLIRKKGGGDDDDDHDHEEKDD
jgi:probable HAF family extracellular repeat protein